jgi:hypothetical protein
MDRITTSDTGIFLISTKIFRNASFWTHWEKRDRGYVAADVCELEFRAISPAQLSGAGVIPFGHGRSAIDLPNGFS